MQTNKNIQNGKGSKSRHKQDDHWRDEHDRIFKKKSEDCNKTSVDYQKKENKQ